jgi:hypothetical protein
MWVVVPTLLNNSYRSLVKSQKLEINLRLNMERLSDIAQNKNLIFFVMQLYQSNPKNISRSFGLTTLAKEVSLQKIC